MVDNLSNRLSISNEQTYFRYLTIDEAKEIIENQEIVERLKKRYNQFGDLTVGEMTIRSWTPGNVTSLLEDILANTTKAGESR